MQTDVQPSFYSESYLKKEDYRKIIYIMGNELDKLIVSFSREMLDKDYVLNSIFSPVMRLMAYFSMTP
jgi:hypothetical protein